MNKCPFCGSKEIIIETPYVNAFGDKEKTYCCISMKKNSEYVKKRFGREANVDPREAAKW